MDQITYALEDSHLECLLEAMLFAAGEPLSVDRICLILGIDKKRLQQISDSLRDHYDFHKRGIMLLRLDDKLQLASRASYADVVRSTVESRRKASLSQSALEVLSIIAYKQPITRAALEQIRSVDCSYTLSSLVEKELVESCGKLDVPGKPTLYKTTTKFLRSFGISGLSELPNLAEMDNAQLSFDEGAVEA